MSDSFLTSWTGAHQDFLSMGFPRQEYWKGCHFLLWGIFLAQGSNLCLLHCRQIPYRWAIKETHKDHCCCSVTQSCLTHLTRLFTISQSLLKLMCTESVMPSNHLILCCPLLLLPSVIPQHRGLFKSLGLYWASWICRFIAFIKFGNISTIILLTSTGIHPPAIIPIICMVCVFIFSCGSPKLCFFF